MKRILLYIFPLLFLFVSCKTETESADVKNNTVYFGGNIINPTSDIIKLSKSDSYSDTLSTKLDKDNFFLFKLDSLESGIYIFQYGKEFQYVYLEKADSLMIRINTLEFDESLVFTGKGATVNNYLIKRYLHNENHSVNLLNLFSLNESDFDSAIDSIKNIEYKILNDFNYEGSDFSEEALNWVNIMLDYTEYSFREMYPYNNTLITKKDSLTRVKKSFYSFRKNINLSDTTLQNNTYFKSYVNARLINNTLDSLFTVISEVDFFNDNRKFESTYGNIFTYYISTFKGENLKNYLYYRFAKDLFTSNVDASVLQEQLVPFFKNVTDIKMVNEINHLLSRYLKLELGSKAPDFEVFDGKNNKMFSSYFGKPIYLFFWLSPDNYNWTSDLTKDYNKLKKQYPNIQFISIYLDYPDTWEQSKKVSGANGIQLTADYKKIKNKYLIPSSNSFVLIDKNGKIIESNTSWPGGKNIKIKLQKIK